MSKQRSFPTHGIFFYGVWWPGHRHRSGARRAVRHAAQVDGGQASRLSSSGGSWTTAARLGGRPAGSGEDDTETGHSVAEEAAAGGARESRLLDELSQLKADSAPMTPLGLSGGEYIRAVACLRLLLAMSAARKHMPVASEMIWAHSATSS